MGRISFSSIIIAVGLIVFILGIIKIKKNHPENKNIFGVIASMFLHMFDAVISVILCAFKYAEVLAMVFGLFLMIFGLSSMHLHLNHHIVSFIMRR